MFGVFWNARGDVYEKVDDIAASGGAKRGTVVRASNKRCRLQDANAYQRLNSLALNLTVTHVIITEYAGTQNGDHWLINGTVYRVVSLLKRQRFAGIGTFFVLGADEVKR